MLRTWSSVVRNLLSAIFRCNAKRLPFQLARGIEGEVDEVEVWLCWRLQEDNRDQLELAKHAEDRWRLQDHELLDGRQHRNVAFNILYGKEKRTTKKRRGEEQWVTC